MVSRQTHFYCCRWIAGVPWGSWAVINEKDCNISESKHCNWTLWEKHLDMEGDKNHKMTSVKEKIDLSKKEKSREILERLWDCKATTGRKDGNFWSSKNRGGRWYKSLTLCICILDSNISLVACFISSGLLIHFFLVVTFYFCCRIQESIFGDIKGEACLNNWFQHCLKGVFLWYITLKNEIVFASFSLFYSIMIRRFKINVKSPWPALDSPITRINTDCHQL